MAIASNLALLEALRASGLLTAEQLAQLPHPVRGHLQDARAAARILARKGWLTVFQINKVLSGSARDLVVGRYHVLDLLGQGGQSMVYKARNTDEGHLVALKVFRTELLGGAEAERQFLMEMEAMASLDHPNVVQFWDADVIGETFYCAMEFVEGTDLGKYVRLVGPLPVAEAAGYVRQAALGLQHAHEHHLIHRDMKPVNLYLTGEQAPASAGGPAAGRLVKILDWGLAGIRRPRQCQAGGPREPKSVIGTADFVSPEQALNPATVDIRGDLYSLGCTLYFLLTAQPPFPGGTLMQKILRHQREDPPPLSAVRQDVPAGLEAVLRRMLAKRPENRYQTPAAVALALAPYCRAEPGSGLVRLPVSLPPRPQEDTPVQSALDTNPHSHTR